MIAILLLAALAAVEVGFYRPQMARRQAGEQALKSARAQLAGAARRRVTDEEILSLMGTGANGESLAALYSSPDALVYLNSRIDASRLSRIDFRTEATSLDGAFRLERFFITLQGSYSRIFNLIKDLEAGNRLSVIEEIQIDPVESSSDLIIRFRVVVYSLPVEAAP